MSPVAKILNKFEKDIIDTQRSSHKFSDAVKIYEETENALRKIFKEENETERDRRNKDIERSLIVIEKMLEFIWRYHSTHLELPNLPHDNFLERGLGQH